MAPLSDKQWTQKKRDPFGNYPLRRQVNKGNGEMSILTHKGPERGRKASLVKLSADGGHGKWDG